MTVGALGKVVFSVSDKQIQTFRNFKRTASANIQTHKRHLMKACTEFTGTEADQISFSVTFSKHLGSDIEKEIKTLKEYLAKGEPVRLTVGTENMGLWLIKQINESYETFGKNGTVTGKNADISLLEFSEV